jgi:hypothetical protein
MAERCPDVHLAVLADHHVDSVNASPPFLNGGNDPSDVVGCHVVVDRQRHDSRADVRRDWQIGELYHLRVRHKVRMPVLWWVVVVASLNRVFAPSPTASGPGRGRIAAPLDRNSFTMLGLDNLMALAAVEATRMGPIQMPDVLMRGVSGARYDGTHGGHGARGRRGSVRARRIAEATEAW